MVNRSRTTITTEIIKTGDHNQDDKQNGDSCNKSKMYNDPYSPTSGVKNVNNLLATFRSFLYVVLTYT